jgi:hypothetical protein
MDYAELAKQYGGTTQPAVAASAPDYAALAKQFGGTTVAPVAPQSLLSKIGDAVMGAGRDFGEAVAPIVQGAGNLVAGGVRGAGSIGATILAPIDIASDALNGKGLSLESNRARRDAMDATLKDWGAQPDSLLYKVGKLGAEVAGTLGAGGAAANMLTRAPGVAAAVPNLLTAMRTGGMEAGAATGIANPLVRAVGGAINGGLSAGAVDPSQAAAGAGIGAVAPKLLQIAGSAGAKAGSAIGNAIAPRASSAVADLADRAQQLGIEIPADRIINSKPLNALAATLNYVPFSGRAATEEAMGTGLNRALSRTFGQNSDNVTQALRAASSDLGGKFDTVLQANTVKMTPAFKTALADAETQANNELGPEASSIIRKQIAEIQTKGAAGEIDGQAAYNIKKTLDRIGNRNTPEAFYARDLKKSLMNALNDSLGPQQAQEFGTLRQQYGNMLDLENLAQNGAEGGVSAARLANMKNIGNPDLQELADIAAQFMRTRESPHGALQRLMIGGGAAGAAHGFGALPFLPVAAAAGRGANMLLSSDAARSAVTGKPNALLDLLAASGDAAAPLIYRGAPTALASGR